MPGSDWGRHSKSCCKTPLGSMAVSTAWQISRGPALPQVCEMCFVMSRAEEVMRECDIHHTRSIKTNSVVNLSRKPGLDLCGDLLQHLQGVPGTCSFYKIIRTSILLVPSLKLSFNWSVTRSNSRIIWMAFFINFVLFCSTCNKIMHITLTPPSMRVIYYPCAEWLWTTSSL